MRDESKSFGMRTKSLRARAGMWGERKSLGTRATVFL